MYLSYMYLSSSASFHLCLITSLLPFPPFSLRPLLTSFSPSSPPFPPCIFLTFLRSSSPSFPLFIWLPTSPPCFLTSLPLSSPFPPCLLTPLPHSGSSRPSAHLPLATFSPSSFLLLLFPPLPFSSRPFLYISPPPPRALACNYLTWDGSLEAATTEATHSLDSCLLTPSWVAVEGLPRLPRIALVGCSCSASRVCTFPRFLCPGNVQLCAASTLCIRMSCFCVPLFLYRF